MKLLVRMVRSALFMKAFLVKAAFILGKALIWLGRRFVLPILIRIYGLVDRIRRILRPAERRFVLVATHRGILHGAVMAVALTTAGGNIYAQTQATVSSGEQSVLYQYITGGSDTVEESGPPSAGNADQYLANIDADSQDQGNAADSMGLEDFDYDSDAMIELGALMPQIIPGSSAPLRRTQVETYTVVAGDTFSGIADKFGISIATILWANNLTVRDFIKPGQTLTILPTTGIMYKVKKGDTVTKIATTYGVSANDIMSWNNITDETAVQNGQDLLVPGGRVIVPPAPIKPKPKPIAAAPKTTVKPADAKDDGSADMIWPAATHYISQPYGIWSRVSGGTHSGVDLAAPVGTPIYAAEDGIVTHASCGTGGCKKSYGLYVDIDHGDGIATRYGHASKLLVSVGDQVRRGQVIALMGSTGRSTGPHLHFEVRKNGRYVNPMPYIR